MSVRIIRVTQTVDYMIEESAQNVDAVLKEWFEDPRYPLDGGHAYRDNNRIGFSAKVISYRELSKEEIAARGKPEGKKGLL